MRFGSCKESGWWQVICLFMLVAPAWGQDVARNDPLAVCHAAVKYNYQLSGCLQMALQQADQALAREEARQLAEFGALHDASRSMRLNAIKQLRPAFLAYRKALCTVLRAQMEPGTGAGAAGLACKIRLTLQQAKDLAGS